ncbi:MAG: GIY-YIG nuclease family protein [Patescibacteria group bacterium]
MFYIYILRSLSHNTLYVGSSKYPRSRLEEHNRGKVRYTKGRMPWELVYKESFSSRAEAMKRERFLKSGQGRKWVKENLKI